ncbi:G-protein coupled receptor 87-like isoform X1 [Acipenser ruthenus]|uniref:G-protein coupled receptor 87-like isoform X1 n=2 Tax=Acipenser ruthenus TaxID=7906 RepID=UPI00145BB8D9|nr:G-protein coupled receptor 87-like isoform X1 [Acipenser ruthenus]XP_034784651.2 G-protein coupled receptor 87-like isoform X1 [Acipenser ruthenus]XP_034784652.2 G-protein coupled receptor 87-like isoform X1 [Acipenser ruthenus]
MEMHPSSNSSNVKTNRTTGKNGTLDEIEMFTVIICSLYTFIFLGGLILNTLAAWIFFQLKNRTTFIFYLKNIAIADLIITLTFPFKILSDSGLGHWKLKAFVCRYSAVIFYCNMYVSILFLGLISLDRYLKIVKPFGNSRMYNVKFTKFVSLGVWLCMILLSMPNMIFTNVNPTIETAGNCSALKSHFGLALHGVVIYVNIGIFTAVFIVLAACYISISRHIYRSNQQFVGSENERKHNQNILIILLVFFICFVPYHLWRIPFTLTQIASKFDKSGTLILTRGKIVTLFMSACNVCLDPIIYFLMCKSFTKMLRKKLHIGPRVDFNGSTRSSRGTVKVRRFREYTSTSI